MSDADGMDNPAFNNADESIGTSANNENSYTESLQENEYTEDKKLSPTSNGRSFVSQHYVEPTRNNPETLQYKTETRIEVPGEEVKTPNNGKANGVHGNGNNNDVGFLNTSVTNVQSNDGKKEQIEAVNLELISMRPYTANNLQTKGQEACELPNDPYEEYFVPVNEHRKYMRGEKLYVTKDKRTKSSYWRRVACWTFGLTLLAFALIIAILAATGVILTQEATKPLENDQPRLLGDTNAAGSQEFIKNPPPSPPPETSSFPPWQTTDNSMMKIIPEALDGSIWLDNLGWSDDFLDVKSRVYRSVAGEIEDSLRDMLHPTSTITNVKVHNITNDGQVMFRISYPSTSVPDVIQDDIEKKLQQNGNMIGKYHLSKMNIKRLIDECEYNNFNCTTNCKFDYTNGIFGCACLPGRLIDDNGNDCIDESDLSDVNMNNDDSQSTTVKDIVQGRSQAPDNSFEPRGHDDQFLLYHNHDHHQHHEHLEHQEHHTHEKTITVPTSESPAMPKVYSDIEVSTEPIAEPKSEPEPVTEPIIESKPKPEPTSEPTAKPEPEPMPITEHTPSHHNIGSDPLLIQKSVPESAGESQSELDSTTEPTSEPITKPEIIFEPNVEPKSEPESGPTTTAEPETSSEIKSMLEVKSSAKPKSEPEPEIILTATQPKSSPEPTVTHKSEAVTDPVPTVEPLAVIPLMLDEETRVLSSEDSESASKNEDNLPTTQEIIEMLPTAIPKTSFIQSDHHHEYEERSNGKSYIAADEENIKKYLTTQSSVSTEKSVLTIPDGQIEIKSDSESSPMESTTITEEVQTENPNMSSTINSLAESNISEIENSTKMAISPTNHTTSQLAPERIDPYALIHNVLGINVTNENPVRNSPASINLQPIIATNIDNNTEKPIETITTTEEKHADDMSPFLPDVVREKESSKKAPRLDKDEQDFPNPFEPHVEDVIVHHHAKTESTMTSNNNTNGAEFTDLNNDTYLSHDVRQTGTTREEDVSMLDMMTTMTSTFSMTEVPGVVDVIDLEERHIDDINSKQLTNDTDDERDNNANLNDNKTSVETKKDLKYNKNQSITNYGSEKIHEELNNKNNETLTINNKFEDNVEDQYNDIFDENITNKFEVNQEEDSKSSKKKPVDIQVNKLDLITTTSKTIETTVMLEDNPTTVDAGIHMENIKTTMTVQTLPVKPIDDNKFTTEVPIMPIEIQQEFLTTEMTSNMDSTIMEVMKNITSNFSMTTQMSIIETKTTGQTPILPEELQTTEATHTVEILNSTSATSESSPSSTESIIDVVKNNNETTIPEITTIPNIKPVSEIISDDQEPDTFDITHFFTTTEYVSTNSDDNDSIDSVHEEDLKVIPLDDEYKNKNEEHDKITDENHFNYPKLNIFEITPTSESSKNQNLESVISNLNNTINSTTIKSIMSDTTTVKTPRKIPEIIPVYEKIEENEENPMLHPLHMTKNNFHLTNMNTKTEENGSEEMQETTNSSTINSTITPSVNAQMNSGSTFIFSKCNAGQFQCVNGTSRDGAYCVHLSSKCDSENDCSDGSDELNCEDTGCPGNFQCRSGQCLGRHLVCNGIGDCDDGSDEDKCDEWKCHFDEFKCPNGRCIPDLWRCNGRPDCEDHRDEYSCSESCGNNEYLCLTENWCIPQTWRCNGVSECANGDDEKLCDCALDQFKCQTGGCVALNQVCDGIEHCPDLSDEWDCLTANMSMENISETSNNDDQTSGSAGQQPLLLSIKQSDNLRYAVCSDNWNKSFSDAYCRSLGYFGSETTLTLARKNEEKFLRLKENYHDNGSNFVSYLEITDACESGEVMKISCQEFSCGSVSDNEGPTARLVGGTPAGEGQWSSVALLKEMKNGAACTASVLGPMHALASYSCIHKYRQSDHWELFIGRDLQKSIRVKTIIPYPQVKYNQFMYNDDIALVQFERPLVFSRNVSAVCLPSQQLQPRALCVTVGWGFPIDGDVNLKLNFLPIPIYNTEECNATSHYAGFITKSNICAGFTGTDKGTCYNDEGAPLMCATETGRWEIQGLLSHHSRCSRGHPAIYSSLSPAISWLQHLIPALQTRT